MKNSVSGQTLIEPILAIAIFSIVLVPFLSSASNILSSQVKQRHQIQAVQYARESLEIAYNQAVNADQWEVFLDQNLGTKTDSIDGDRFIRQTSVDYACRGSDQNLMENGCSPDQQDPNTIKVVCNLAWQEKGQEESVELITYLINFEEF